MLKTSRTYFGTPLVAKRPPGYWDDKRNIDNFIKYLKQKLELNTISDWVSLSRKQIRDNGGSSLVSKYSLYEIKCIGCPEGKNKFTKPVLKKPTGYWDKMANVQKFLFELQSTLNLKNIDDWNALSSKQIRENGGRNLLHKYSMYELKSIGFPEGKSKYFLPKKPSSYWKKEENIDDFFIELQQKYNLNSFNDWNRLSSFQIRSNGGWGLISNFSKGEIIRKKYNSNDFTSISNKFTPKSSQRWLFLQVQKLFPGEEIVEDYFHSEISRESGFSVQFDIFLVKQNIAIEYQGKQHYEDIPAFVPIEMYKLRDKEKQKICNKFGIRLIIIPHWWDNSLGSLQHSINSVLRESQNI